MADWNFLTNHGRALLCIGGDQGLRLRDIAERLGITERSAYAIVNDLTDGGYLTKSRDGRRNRYEIQSHLPVKESVGRQPTVGEILGLFVDAEGNSGTHHSANVKRSTPVREKAVGKKAVGKETSGAKVSQ
jgi:DNA-binding transcriptional regulator LsrR (DeoR family)